MNNKELGDLYKKYLVKGSGPITISEAQFIGKLIEKYKPKTFLEIGTASGLSGGIIARFLDKNMGNQFITVDLSRKFYADVTKSTGYLIPKIYKSDKINCRVELGCMSKDLNNLKINNVDMVFIDANHQHPWPTIDTMLIYPLLNKDAIIIHHDYNLFKVQGYRHGIGPKFLANSISAKLHFPGDGRNNIYSFSTKDWSIEKSNRELSNSLELPWTNIENINEELFLEISNKIGSFWGSETMSLFNRMYKREVSYRNSLLVRRKKREKNWNEEIERLKSLLSIKES